MTTPKPDLSPGWVDRLPRTEAEQEDERRAKDWKPRRAWRGNGDVQQESRLRGARKAGKRKLPEVRFVEDEVE